MIPPLVMALASFAPQIVTLLGGPKAGEVADKVLDIAKAVTGTDTPDAAVAAIQRDPEMAYKFQAAIAEKEVELAKIDAEVSKAYFAAEGAAVGQVNETMRGEGASEHWQQYSWRPSIGFSVALLVLLIGLVVVVAFGGVILFQRDASVLAHIPTMIGAIAALLAVVTPILGIASWHRGKQKIVEAGG